MVGLFGMGGVGKTTLSKAFYNLNACKYVKSCYLGDVKSKQVPVVQKELLRGLCGVKLDQHETVSKEDVDTIKNCFMTQKVLVVIDNVSSVECLEALQVFEALETRCQSKVVVTGRNKGILKKYLNLGKVVIESVNGITEGSGMELFLRYAFASVHKDEEDKVNAELFGEAKKIVQLCDGLPLSLEVLGKYLGNSRDEDEDEDEDLQKWKKTWAAAYDRLQKAQSINEDDQLWSTLRISYDSLGDLEKKMFLDFACIFSEPNRFEKRLAEWIWDSPAEVKNLVNTSLLKVQGDYFDMHNQLRDMGRHMLLEALEQHPIYLWDGFEDHSKTYMEFKKLTSASVPYVASLKQEVGTSLHQYSKLRVFRVAKCKTPSLVDDCLSQCSGDLRWLQLANSKVTKIGLQNLGSFGDLRVFQIHRCEDIVELPEAIGELGHLVEIEVSQCCNLQSLPHSVGKLKNLKKLVIDWCKLRAIPNSVGELSEVEYLSFEGCQQVTVIEGSQICTQKLVELRLPVMPTARLRPCPQLQELLIYDCQGVKEFPQDFFKMDMPKLKVVFWINHKCVDVVLKNPNGSELELNSSGSMFGVNKWKVERCSNGSILQLIPLCPSGSEVASMVRFCD